MDLSSIVEKLRDNYNFGTAMKLLYEYKIDYLRQTEIYGDVLNRVSQNKLRSGTLRLDLFVPPVGEGEMTKSIKGKSSVLTITNPTFK
jgi:hypothetical protein